jgi:hypothetical protein
MVSVRRWFWFARGFTAVVGISSIAWASSSFPFYRAEAPLASSAQTILLGESYSEAQLKALSVQLNAASRSQIRSSALYDVAVIRLQLAENALTTGNTQLASYLVDLETALNAAIAEVPTSSFLWLTKYWLHGVRGGAADGGLQFLRMSYLSGPNEGWIAARRNPLALRFFSSLPDDLRERVLAEFERLVSSGFYWEAVNILTGPGWAVHEKLLSRLGQVKEDNRRAFATVLESRNLDGAMVPGIAQRSARPF